LLPITAGATPQRPRKVAINILRSQIRWHAFLFDVLRLQPERQKVAQRASAGLACKPEQAALLLEECAIDPMQRAETLSLAGWARLTAEFLKEKTDGKAG